uniref:Uncharacterized protein n=1 Tax=Avena sativa TaxID=4498 RepID=A0ACD5W7Q1_AVESA
MFWFQGMLGDGTSVVKRLVKGVDIDEEKLSEVIRSPMKAKHKRTSQFCPDTEGETVDCEVELVLANLCQRFFCFEYLSEGSLYKQITDASHGHEWTRQYQIMKGIFDGPCYLNIVQLDLKPTNILLDFNGMPKIVDCGIPMCFEKKQSWVITSKFDWNNTLSKEVTTRIHLILPYFG